MWRRRSRFLHDRGLFISIRADVQGFRIIREGGARRHGLLFDDRLGAFNGDDLHFDDGRRECYSSPGFPPELTVDVVLFFFLVTHPPAISHYVRILSHPSVAFVSVDPPPLPPALTVQTRAFV